MDKQALRERVWDDLDESGEARFPFPPHGRIPNFAGADDAAAAVADLQEWQDAAALKANPDAPQLPVRRRALAADKRVYMAVPRLASERPFRELAPERLRENGVDTNDAATIGGSEEHGDPVCPGEMTPVDAVVVGSVAVTEDGARVGKGEGYSDLEFALLREFGLADDETATITTVHERQVVEEDVPVGAHDVPLDVVVTPERTVRTDAGGTPDGIDWDAVTDEQLAEIPVLDGLRDAE
jgi:5-formyltetrahydrofolate cyclo-ligase